MDRFFFAIFALTVHFQAKSLIITSNIGHPFEAISQLSSPHDVEDDDPLQRGQLDELPVHLQTDLAVEIAALGTEHLAQAHLERKKTIVCLIFGLEKGFLSRYFSFGLTF